MREREYASRLVWDGNRGDGTAGYEAYGREYRILVEAKPPLAGSADEAFRGDPQTHNPEDLFLGSLAACHMLFYLALCARAGVRVVAYEDAPSARLALEADGGGRLEEVVLRPAVAVLGAERDAERALALHATAHERCFLARSCRVPIRHEPRVRMAEPAR